MKSGLGSSRRFPELTRANVRGIFSHVYDKSLKLECKNEGDDQLKDFIPIVLAYTHYISNHRSDERFLMHHLAKDIRDFEINSEGTDWWMFMIIAMEELYHLGRSELIDMIKKTKGMQ